MPELKKFVVTSTTGLVLEGSEDVHALGEVLELDPNDELVQAHLASGALGPFKTREEMVAELGEEEVAKIEAEAETVKEETNEAAAE